MTQQEASWVASLSMLGAWFGAMIGDWVMRRGRRLALRVTSLPLAVVWILTGIAPCVELVYVTSFIGGLCCSVITMVAQVYLYIYVYTVFSSRSRFKTNFSRCTYRKSRCRASGVACRLC